MVGLFALAAVLVGTHVVAYRELSPFDEPVHYDYVVKISTGDIVQKGERLGQEAMRVTACRGIDHPGVRLPPCNQSEPHEPGDFPARGYNTADIHPPVYYYLTSIAAHAVTAISPVDSPFTAARLVGILWLGLGLIVFWLVGKELGVPAMPLAAVTVLVASNPTIVLASATVNNDAPALFAGAGITLATLWWERGKLALWALGVIAFIAPAFKMTNVIAVGLCALYLFIRERLAPRDRGHSNRRSGYPAIGVLALAAALSVIGWLMVHSALARVDFTPVEQAFETSVLSFDEVMQQLLQLVTPVSHGVPVGPVSALHLTVLATTFGALIVVACFAPLLSGRLQDRSGALAGAGGLSMLLGGVLFFFANILLLGVAVDVQPRYGLSLVPALGLAVATSIQWRGARWAVATFAVAVVGLTLGAVIPAV